MQLEPGLVLAAQDIATAPRIGVTIAVAVAIAAVIARKRLPPGVSEGAFIAGVSGALVLLLAVDSSGEVAEPKLGLVLTGLAVLWYALSRAAAGWYSHGSRLREGVDAEETGHDGRQVLTCAALLCGLAAVNRNLWTGAVQASMPPIAGAQLVVLLVLAVVAMATSRGLRAVYPVVALSICLSVAAFPISYVDAPAAAWGWGMNVAGLVSLLVVIGLALSRWWRRRRYWLENPERLIDLPPTYSALLVPLVSVSVLIGLAGLLQREAAFTPTAVLLGALTCLTIGHLRTWVVASEIGLILIGECIVTASLAWLQPGWSGALFGLGLTCGYLLWLARFWDQQLDEGVAWTTAGRMVPIARRLAHVAAAAAVGVVIGGVGSGSLDAQPSWVAAVTVVVLLGSMSLLVRDGSEHPQRGSTLAACLMALAAAGSGWGLLLRLPGSSVSLVVAIAGAATLLALRVSLARRGGANAPVYNGCLGGALPVIVLLGLAWRGLDAQIAATLVLTATALVVGFGAFSTEPRIARAGRI